MSVMISPACTVAIVTVRFQVFFGYQFVLDNVDQNYVKLILGFKTVLVVLLCPIQTVNVRSVKISWFSNCSD